MTEAELRSKVVNIMKAWRGAQQGSVRHREIIDLYNSYTPHPRGYKMTYSAPWCAATVSAAGIQAGLTDIMPVECSCASLIELYRQKGRWVESDAYRPDIGDLVLYDWQDTGKGDNTGAPDHVGMVCSLNPNSTMTICEGNMGSDHKVGTRDITINARYIRGFCCPDYAAAAKMSVSANQQTVQNAVDDGVVSSPNYWLSVLDGKETANPGNIKALMDKYHEALLDKK